MNALNYIFVLSLGLATTAYPQRTCVDVQKTLQACIDSSGGEVMDTLLKTCWHVGVMLECVAEAEGQCPDLPLLADSHFARGIGNMQKVQGRDCAHLASRGGPRPSDPDAERMSNDQPAASACDPNKELLICSDLMIDNDPEDVKAICGPGEAYVACLTNIVTTCPQHAHILSFNLQEYIDSIRARINRECPAATSHLSHMCQDKIEEFKRRCAHYLGDGTSGNYCRSLELYRGCIDDTLTDCPHPAVQRDILHHYLLHCPVAGGDRNL